MFKELIQIFWPGFSLAHGFALWDVGSIIGAGVSLASGLSGSDAASSAVDAQVAGAQASIAEQRRQYDQARTDTAPYRASGEAANSLLDEYLGTGSGVGGTPATTAFTPLSYSAWARTHQPQSNNNGDSFVVNALNRGNPQNTQAQYQAYLAANPARAASAGVAGTHSANYGSLLKPFSTTDLNNDVVYNTGLDFGLNEGTKAIDRLASAHGGTESGATLKALARYANDYGSQKAGAAYDRYTANKNQTYDFLNGVANRGVNAVGTVTGAGGTMANNVSNSLEGAGNAQAAGAIGSANAWSSALGGIAKQFPSNSSIFNPSSNTVQYNNSAGGGTFA